MKCYIVENINKNVMLIMHYFLPIFSNVNLFLLSYVGKKSCFDALNCSKPSATWIIFIAVNQLKVSNSFVNFL